MNPFVQRITGSSWVWSVSLFSLFLGFILTAAWVTNISRASRLPLIGASQQNRVAFGPIDLQENYTKLQLEVQKLRAKNTELEKAVGSQTSSTQILNENLQDTKVFAGLTPVEGPGVIVTLRDSAKPLTGFTSDAAIHYYDVLRVVNELWAASSEAVAVNGHRIVGSSSFQCVGSTILVDNNKIAPPIAVRAIGDPRTIEGALNIPGGVIAEIKSQDPAMVSIETADKLSLPAFAGNTTRKFVQVSKDAK